MSGPFSIDYVSLSDDSFVLACTRSNWQGDSKHCRWCDKPLVGRQVRWCSPSCANDAGAEHWWSAASKRVRQERRHCARCGKRDNELRSPQRLEAHHVIPARGAHDKCSCLHHHDNVEVLCTDCHLNEHRIRRDNERFPHAMRLPIDSTEALDRADPANHQEHSASTASAHSPSPSSDA